MGGIAGIMMRDGASPSQTALDVMLSALDRRGPDGRGRYASGDMAMVETRLAIVEPSKGDQPLFEPGGASLIADGEIYNAPELRTALAGEGSGVDLDSRADFDPALRFYARDGVRFTERLRGMYAIAIHDPGSGGQLVLTRDPFGIKPLYYVENEAFFAFASEPNALIAAGLATAAVEPVGRDVFLQLQFSCGVTTPIAGIRRVLPGETLVVRQARVVERRRRHALPQSGIRADDEAAALKRLDEAILESVDLHRRADVPYGLFLSGGVDSAVVLSALTEVADTSFPTYSARLVDDGASATSDTGSDAACARRLAEKLGTDHHEVTFGEADFWSLLPRVVAAMDDPAADYAALPMWKLAETAAADVKTVLTGEGGDELFAGYGRYRSVLRPWWLGGRSIRHRGTFDGLGVLRVQPDAWRDAISGREAQDAALGRTRLQSAQAADCEDWLSNDLLMKLDRCLMPHGLEGRTPLLDPMVAEVAFPLPDRLKIRDGYGKWILRRWLDRRLPEAGAFSRRRGGSIPVGRWIAARGVELGNLVAERDAIRAIAEPQAVRRLFEAAGKKRNGLAAWSLLVYALWHASLIERCDIRAATVFEALEMSE